MHKPKPKITVFYDGSCPRCVQDRKDYERIDPLSKDELEWFDISHQDQALEQLGIQPHKALTELHIRTQTGEILSEIEAYQVLLARIPRYRWLSWLIGLPLIRPLLGYVYRRWVIRRLRKEGRL